MADAGSRADGVAISDSKASRGNPTKAPPLDLDGGTAGDEGRGRCGQRPGFALDCEKQFEEEPAS